MNWRGWMVFAALGIVRGLPYFFIKLAIVGLTPVAIAWGRIVLAALILLPIAWQRGALHAMVAHKLAVCAFAVVEFVIPFSAIALGERWISSSLAGILIATVPLTIAPLSRFFGLHEPLGAWRLTGLILGFIGVVILLGFGTVSGVAGWAGVGCMLMAVLGYSIGPLIIQRYLGSVDPFGPLAASLLVASIVLLPAAVFALPNQVPAPLVLWSLGILGAVCTAFGMLLWFYLIGHAGAARASVITYINPVVATLLGASLLHEHLGVAGYIAFALILLGSWLATRGRTRRREAPSRDSGAAGLESPGRNH
jgi:drug/metabolite transporter (DMT)-like permease